MAARRIFGEEKPAPRKLSSTQFELPGRHAELMLSLGRQIPDYDLAPDGRETEPHITARYGLHFQTPTKRLREAVRNFGPITVTLGKTSLFSNSDADVVKIDVDSPDLHRLYKIIGKLGGPVETTHPTYEPHATVAYVKPGRGKKYSGLSTLAGRRITFDRLTFSGHNGQRQSIPLSGGPPPFAAR